MVLWVIFLLYFLLLYHILHYFPFWPTLTVNGKVMRKFEILLFAFIFMLCLSKHSRHCSEKLNIHKTMEKFEDPSPYLARLVKYWYKQTLLLIHLVLDSYVIDLRGLRDTEGWLTHPRVANSLNLHWCVEAIRGNGLMQLSYRLMDIRLRTFELISDQKKLMKLPKF